MDYAALKDELTNDPLTRGYAEMDDRAAADDLNTPYRTVPKSSLSGDEIFQQTDATEFAGLTADKRDLWVSFTSKASVDPYATSNVEFVKWIFGDTAQTVQNLAAIRDKTGSRAVELFGSSVTPSQVANARRLS